MMMLLDRLHRRFARLHGAGTAPADAVGDLAGLYRAYARATVKASHLLRKHGKDSAEFVAADIASMRLFHRVKKSQGLKKVRPS